MNSISSGNLCSVQFNNVYMLFIAIPLIAILLVPFFIAVKKDNVNVHNATSGVLHVIMAILIAFAAAGTQIVAVMTQIEVYVVADVSYSANKNLDTIDNYITDLSKTLPRNSKMGVVCFGKDYALIAEPGQKIPSVKDSGVDDTETNIVEAIEYSASLFKTDVIKRMVIITDGKQTYDANSGNLRRTVSGLQTQDIRIDAIYLNDSLSEEAKEVQISNASYTKNTYVDSSEEVNVIIQSNVRTNAIVTLSRDGEKIDSKAQSLSVGSNSIYFTLDTAEAGVYDYMLVIDAEDDELDINNEYTFTQTVSDQFNVLLLSSKWTDTVSIIQTYGEEVSVEAYDSDASVTDKVKNSYVSGLGEQSGTVIHINNLDVPYSVEDLSKYDEIVINAVDLTDIYDGADMYDMFMNSLSTVVSSFGKSLITFGDLGIQSKTEGELQVLDDMLPVRFGDVAGEGKLYTLVFDVSYSMNMWSRLNLAKQTAEQLVNTFSENDSVCIVFFAGDIEVKLAPTRMDDKDRILNVLRNVDFRNGTLAGIGLEKAMQTIINLDVYEERRVVLITDGLTYEGTVGSDGRDDKQVAKDSAERMRAYGIYTTVICVGGDDGTVDRTWLADVARLGGTKSYYHITSVTQIAGVVLEDIVKDFGDAVVKKTKWINVKKSLDNVLSDVALGENTAFIQEYVVSRAKTSATTVLTIQHEVGNITIDVPLYAYRDYGNGKVASYTGNFYEINRKGGVISDEDNSAFFGAIFRTSTPDEKVDHPYTVTSTVEGKTARIEIAPAEMHPTAPAQITVTAPDGTQTTDSFYYNYTNYYYEFAMRDIGKYVVGIDYTYGGKTYSAETVINLSYEPEYDAFAVYDAAVLYTMLGGDGTVSEDGKLVIEIDEKEISSYIIDLAMPFLITCVVLFVADVIIRKLKWNDIVSLFTKVGQKKGGK